MRYLLKTIYVFGLLLVLSFVISACNFNSEPKLNNYSSLYHEINEKAPEEIQGNYDDLIHRIQNKQHLFTTEYPNVDDSHKKRTCIVV